MTVLARTRAAPHKRDGVATRARIEREALRLFGEKGFDATSIRDISLAVGVADPALYRYFPSKDALGRDIFLTHYGELARAIARIDAGGAPFAGKVAALVDLFCAMFDTRPELFSFILLSQHAYLRFVPDVAADNAVEALCQLVAGAMQRGEVARGDPRLAAAMALGAVLQPAVFALYGRLPRPLGAHAATIAGAALGAIGGA